MLPLLDVLGYAPVWLLHVQPFANITAINIFLFSCYLVQAPEWLLHLLHGFYLFLCMHFLGVCPLFVLVVVDLTLASDLRIPFW